jgi:hypothetical protein
MKRLKNQNTISSKPRNISHKCDSCGLVSKNVNKSLKFNKYYCLDCLKDAILSSPKE